MDKRASCFRGKWKQLYHSASIQLILSVAFTTVAVMGMLFLGVALMLRFSSSSNAMAAESSQRVLAQVNLNLDSYLRSMMRVSDTVYYRVIKNTDLQREDMARELRDALDLLYAKDREVLVSLAVFDGSGSLVSATPLSELKNSVIPSRESWFTTAMERIENLHFSTPHVQNLFDDPDSRYHWVVSLSRHVELSRGGVMQSGVLLVDMSFGGIEQICKEVSLSNGQGYLYLIDGSGEIIYHPRQQLIYAGLQEENNLTAAAYSDGTHTERFLSQRRQVTVKTVGYTGWKLVGVVPVETLRDNYSQLLLFAMFVVIFSIFLLVFVNLRLSEWITAPMKKLELAVRELEKGAESVDFDVDGPYEVEHLSRSVQSMVSTMRHLMEDILRQEEEKRRSELDVLQSQINPHFLYNTLDSVVWMTENGRTQEAVAMLTALARFFRISLSKGSSIIPIGDELEHARNYLAIQKMRYKNKFFADISVEQGVERLYTVKLIIQPILENAIYHGMEYADGDGEIHIRAFREGENMVIEVEDNGPGMPEQVVEQLLNPGISVSAARPGGTGIGLRNVHQRIQLTFGPAYGLTIRSEPDRGTVVRICLPALGENEVRKYRRERREPKGVIPTGASPDRIEHTLLDAGLCSRRTEESARSAGDVCHPSRRRRRSFHHAKGHGAGGGGSECGAALPDAHRGQQRRRAGASAGEGDGGRHTGYPAASGGSGRAG